MLVLFHEEISTQGKAGDNEMKGLCRKCMSSNQDLVLTRDHRYMCISCAESYV